MAFLMQKERLTSPQKSLYIIMENRAFGDITETAVLVILASHFRAMMATPKKVPLGVLLR